jgi:flagellar hook-associated protein FlgK
MSLTLALSNALSGLRINQQSIGVLSNNISNVNTLGYSRQVVNQSSVTVEGVGSGVKLEEIVRKVDSYIQRSIITQSSNVSNSQAIDEFYQRVQTLLGQPGSGNSMDVFLTSFFNSVQQLAETPETTSLKSNAISSAAFLAKQLADLSANIYNLRYEADRQISDSVSVVNSTLDRLRDINKALNQAKSLGQSTAGLLDERDKELQKISEYINITTSFNQSGGVSIVGGDGVTLLEEGVRYQLRYARLESVESLVQDAPMSGLEVVSLNEKNEAVGLPVSLITAGRSSEITSKIPSGKISGYQQIRDTKFPAILDQLDMLASRIRDNVNTIHNKGSGFPPATSLTGERQVRATDQYSWTGQVRIAVLQQNGKPVTSRYPDEAYTGIRPLLIDLARLDSGQGAGKPTMQTIIDEINNHFSAPGNKAKLGNINNIQLASDTNLLPSGGPSLFNFDLDIENISEDPASVFVTGITVLDDTATNITSVTQPAPSRTISTTNSYVTSAGLPDVTINFTTPPGAQVGEQIYLNAPSGPVNGIPAASLTGFFTVTAVSGNSVTITAGAPAAVTGPVNDPGAIQAFPPYDSLAAGEKDRTRDRGQMQVDLSGNVLSSYYDITVNVSVVDGDGVVHSAPITYRVDNNVRDILNTRYDARAVGGAGTMILPGESQESLRAILVDANGQELPTINGKYIDGPSFLKIVGGNDGVEYSVAIDELTSRQEGKPDGSPVEAGTGWGFSHYFGLNNFFESNAPIIAGDTLRNSAYYMKVQDRLIQNGNLLSTGNLTKQEKSTSSNGQEVYTYARYSGDNSVAQRIAKLNTDILIFDPAGGLPQTQQSLQGYTSDLLGFVSRNSVEASDNAENAKVLYDGFKGKGDEISGVNLDEELANTVTFQNAYSATARVITVVNKMYDDLLQTF